MQRILVLGSSGSGKSTFARRLSARLGIELIHLDSHYWNPHWTCTPEIEWECKLDALLTSESWVMDGNYPASLEKRLERADTVVFLDSGRLSCLWRCLQRWRRYRGTNRPELPPGCYEKIDWEFFQWIWNYPRKIKPALLEALDSQDQAQVIVLKGQREIESFLSRLPRTRADTAAHHRDPCVRPGASPPALAENEDHEPTA